MADRSTHLLLQALSRAAADGAGVPLLGSKTTPGLFATTASGKSVARRCLDDGLLRVVRTETRGKASVDICTITDKGLARLFGQVSPRQILEDFVRVLEAKQSQLGELLMIARQMQTGIDALKLSAERVLQRMQQVNAVSTPSVNGSSHDARSWTDAVLDHLARRSEDCPLPELFREAQRLAAALTIGRFHDGLRRLLDAGQIYLHPWTGPLYTLPEPAVALLVGHEIAYYASKRAV
jgi:hypothetical protein